MELQKKRHYTMDMPSDNMEIVTSNKKKARGYPKTVKLLPGLIVLKIVIIPLKFLCGF